MAALHLTTTERRLAETYVSVLDYMSRCALGVDRGDWHYLWDKAADLATVAEALAAVAAELAQTTPQRSRHAAQRVARAAAVRAAVAHFGRHYRAAQLLHPVSAPRPGGEDR